MRTSEYPPIALRRRRLIHIANRDMDRYLAWIMGRARSGGSDPSECVGAAERIRSGDPRSWQRVWSDLAEHVEQQARRYEAQGDLPRARHAFFRACSYYRAPLFLMSPDDGTFVPYWERMRACFRRAAMLSDPQIQPIRVPFRDTQLPGYFWAPGGATLRSPTLIVIGGVESFAEDSYFMIGSVGAERGYAILTVDLPGQGMTPRSALYLDAHADPAVQAVLAYAQAHPRVAPEQIALYGVGWGGHLALKGARDDQYENRILSALIVNPVLSRPGHVRWPDWPQRSSDRIGQIIGEQIAWRRGRSRGLTLQAIACEIAHAAESILHGAIDLRTITCPTLCLAGAGEPRANLANAHAALQRLPNPQSRLVTFTSEEGGSPYGMLEHPMLASRTIMNWLNSIFARS